jgi:hypothetical protein
MTPASVICAQACEAARSLGDESVTLLLTGSLAREEATFEMQDGVLTGMGDADFFMISSTAGPETAGRLKNDVEERLRCHQIACSVNVNAVDTHYLRNLPPHILTYEMRDSGRVIYGDPAVLKLIPVYRKDELSLRDAFCLLSNRMIEFLEIAPELPASPIHYRTVKLYLDMATAFLLAHGAYQPTYRSRAAELRRHAAAWKACDFAMRVDVCTEIKLSGPRSAPVGSPSWQQAIYDAHRVWRLLLLQLTGAEPALSDSALFHRLIRQQPLAEKVRGWLSVFRHGGPRRLRECWTMKDLFASPRYLLYKAASERFFGLPWTLGSDAYTRRIAVAYHQVLEKTRA